MGVGGWEGVGGQLKAPPLGLFGLAMSLRRTVWTSHRPKYA